MSFLLTLSRYLAQISERKAQPGEKAFMPNLCIYAAAKEWLSRYHFWVPLVLV
jgi:hypothetical protein